MLSAMISLRGPGTQGYSRGTASQVANHGILRSTAL